jgi:uncharacterized membrane protein YkoI
LDPSRRLQFPLKIKEVAKRQVLPNVLTAFQKSYPNATNVKYEDTEADGKRFYEIEFKDKGNEFEALYQPDGTLLEIKEEIAMTALPQPVIQSVNKAHPNGIIQEVERIMKPGGYIVGYEVEIRDGGKELELTLGSDGRVLKADQG